jgi:hypothetical protein
MCPDSWDLAQLRVPDMDLRAYRRICGTCVFLVLLKPLLLCYLDED